ncbi:L,D-transpeptidase scaffold domain-containing protein [Mucilaginibacter sp.]
MISSILSRNRMLFTISLLAFAAALLVLQSCRKKSRSDMGEALYKSTQNKVYRNITPEGYEQVFLKVLGEEKSRLSNPNQITAFYEANENDPVFVMEHLKNNDLRALADYCQRAGEHGLNPQLYKGDEIMALVNKINGKKTIKTTDEAYEAMAHLELLTANALLDYTNALEFGVISPRKIYARYYTETKRPDSISMNAVLATKNFRTFLDSIQPKNPQYIALQKALTSSVMATGMTKEQTQRTILVNLERLRWKNKPNAGKYVIVNIPDYRLDVMEQGKSIMNMKVCVGEGRNTDNRVTLAEYDESGNKDRPFTRETPQLNSMINVAQVNPVWNIPESIASNEISKHAAADPYYLDNENIDVYKNGKKVEDAETIDWSTAGSDYSFKQRPGDHNALGKIKFLFPNNSSVYLHDTPAKAAFNQSMRAVSHGCVRVEKALDLARALFGDGSSKYQTIEQDMGKDDPTPEDLTLPKKVPVYITYVTCWVGDNNTLQFRKDVYGLDMVLFGHLQKRMSLPAQHSI